MLKFEVFMFYTQVGCVCIWQILQYTNALVVRGFKEDREDELIEDSLETFMTDFVLLSSSFIMTIANFEIMSLQTNKDPGYSP